MNLKYYYPVNLTELEFVQSILGEKVVIKFNHQK